LEIAGDTAALEPAAEELGIINGRRKTEATGAGMMSRGFAPLP
jgi:hypothetical protein